jgi:hypothetical protein
MCWARLDRLIVLDRKAKRSILLRRVGWAAKQARMDRSGIWKQQAVRSIWNIINDWNIILLQVKAGIACCYTGAFHA